jgi:hypothetical protein
MRSPLRQANGAWRRVLPFTRPSLMLLRDTSWNAVRVPAVNVADHEREAGRCWRTLTEAHGASASRDRCGDDRPRVIDPRRLSMATSRDAVSRLTGERFRDAAAAPGFGIAARRCSSG